MSLRPRDPGIARIARAGQRMAPGGRRWSESPIPRPAVRRIRAGAAAPTYWWKFDNASGSTPEVGGGASIVYDNTVTHHATALAPGSTYALTIPIATGTTGQASVTPPLGAGGTIALDFWVSGLALPATGSAVLFQMWDTVSPAGEFSIVMNGDTNEMEFSIDGTAVDGVATWADPAPIRGGLNLTPGGSVVANHGPRDPHDARDHANGDNTAPWAFYISSSDVDATWDELKVYGT